MKQCKRCSFYDEIEDLIMGSDGDEYEANKDGHHFCFVYNKLNNFIPTDILNDTIKCDFFVDDKDLGIQSFKKKLNRPIY